MDAPGTLIQVAIFAVFVLPGIAFATTRVALVGVRSADLSTSARVLEALSVSVLFNAVYVLIFFDFVQGAVEDPQGTLLKLDFSIAVTIVALLVGVPVVAALALSLKPRFSFYKKGEQFAEYTERKATRARDKQEKENKRRFHLYWGSGYKSMPSGWDYNALSMSEARLVRVRTESGIYYGGWYDTNSYMSTYPRDRDIFIQSQWTMKLNGDFDKKIEGGLGIWIAITDKTVVDWIAAPMEKNEGTSD